MYCVSGLSGQRPDNFLVIRYSPNSQSPWRQDANMRNGDVVEVVGESGAFYRVRFQNRFEGWSAKRYLVRCNNNAPPSPGGPARAIPIEFHGVWRIAANTQQPQCRRQDWDNERSDNMIQVTGREVRYYESACSPATMRHVESNSFEATMSCSGEGMAWTATDHYSVQKMGGRKLLVIVNIRRTASRDETGKVYPDDNLDKVVTSIAEECR